MSDDPFAGAREQLLDGLRQSHDAVLAGVHAMSGASKLAPLELPSWAAGLTPRAEVVIENTVGLAERILASQRRFLLDLCAAMAPGR